MYVLDSDILSLGENMGTHRFGGDIKRPPFGLIGRQHPANHRRDGLVWREDAHVLSIPGMR